MEIKFNGTLYCRESQIKEWLESTRISLEIGFGSNFTLTGRGDYNVNFHLLKKDGFVYLLMELGGRELVRIKLNNVTLEGIKSLILFKDLVGYVNL